MRNLSKLVLSLSLARSHRERVQNSARTRDTALHSTTPAVTALNATASTLHSKAQAKPKCPTGTLLGFRAQGLAFRHRVSLDCKAQAKPECPAGTFLGFGVQGLAFRHTVSLDCKAQAKPKCPASTFSRKSVCVRVSCVCVCVCVVCVRVGGWVGGRVSVTHVTLCSGTY